MFHTARWEYDYSGGSQKNPVLDKLADKRVAIIGTGATAGTIRISTAAFTYAAPLVAEIEGVRGLYFSKRLHHALVNFVNGRVCWPQFDDLWTNLRNKSPIAGTARR